MVTQKETTTVLTKFFLQRFSRKSKAIEPKKSEINVGEKLKAARLNEGDTLQDLAHILKVRRKYLEAIEENAIHELPESTYALGFVKCYANHYGLNASALSNKFKQDYYLSQEKKQFKPKPVLIEKTTPSILILWISCFLLIAVYSFWYKLSENEKMIFNQEEAFQQSYILERDEGRPVIQETQQADSDFFDFN